MTTDPSDLPWVLRCTGDRQAASLWRATTMAELDRAAPEALETIHVWSQPAESGLGMTYDHARASLLAYVLTSTYRMRKAEFRDLDDWRTPNG